METHGPTQVNLTAESAHLVKTLLEKHRRTITNEQDKNTPVSDSELRSVKWVVSKDFTTETGKRQIVEYIATWEIQPCWFYSVDFLHASEEEHHTFYHYRARFSTPTSRKPIRGTASVYFIVDVSKMKARAMPVEVRFVVESNRLVHTPGEIRFTEKWLVDVIESKTSLRNAVQF